MMPVALHVLQQRKDVVHVTHKWHWTLTTPVPAGSDKQPQRLTSKQWIHPSTLGKLANQPPVCQCQLWA